MKAVLQYVVVICLLGPGCQGDSLQTPQNRVANGAASKIAATQPGTRRSGISARALATASAKVARYRDVAA